MEKDEQKGKGGCGECLGRLARTFAFAGIDFSTRQNPVTARGSSFTTTTTTLLLTTLYLSVDTHLESREQLCNTRANSLSLSFHFQRSYKIQIHPRVWKKNGKKKKKKKCSRVRIVAASAIILGISLALFPWSLPKSSRITRSL